MAHPCWSNRLPSQVGQRELRDPVPFNHCMTRQCDGADLQFRRGHSQTSFAQPRLREANGPSKASAGRLCSPAARVGSIFLSEFLRCTVSRRALEARHLLAQMRMLSHHGLPRIQHMHSTARGFETSRGGVFQHFGYITFCLMLLFGLVVISFLLFQLGFLK